MIDHIAKSYSVVLMDEISIASDSAKEDQKHVGAVMDIFRSNNFRLKEKNHTFEMQEIEFIHY
jgi:hypothetical protein